MVSDPNRPSLAQVLKPAQGYTLREATSSDIPALVSHRRRMFEDMAALRGEALVAAEVDAMDAAYARQLSRMLADGSLRAWVIEAEGRVVAGGAILIAEWLPRPRDLTRRLAYLHSVYTEPEHRRRGLARLIVRAAIEACRADGLRRLTLHASGEGRPLYESLGFRQTNEMRLVLD
jgi:GNAT superfamily N-acetyltransferase